MKDTSTEPPAAKRSKTPAPAGLFQNENLRTLPDDFDGNLRTYGTLVRVTAAKQVAFANSVGERDRLVNSLQPEDLLVFLWPGQWKTDAFYLRPVDLARHYKN